MLYRYQKKIQTPKYRPRVRPLVAKKRQLLSFGLIFLGVIVFGYLVSFYSLWFFSTGSGNDGLNNPLLRAKTDWLSTLFPGSKVLGTKSESGLVYSQFYLTVPGLKITKAVVTTNVVSSKEEAYLPILEKSIAHYKGTSLPGQEGNSFLYGHSVLPEFFNTKDYMTIFSNLHKLKVGDTVVIDYGNSQFKYQVYDKNIVDPKNIEVVNTSGMGEKTLTLMTCSPPGTELKRLLISAKIVE